MGSDKDGKRSFLCLPLGEVNDEKTIFWFSSSVNAVQVHLDWWLICVEAGYIRREGMREKVRERVGDREGGREGEMEG